MFLGFVFPWHGKCKQIFSSKSLQPVGVWWASYIKNKQSFILQWNNGSTKIWLALPCLGELQEGLYVRAVELLVELSQPGCQGPAGEGETLTNKKID